MFPLPDWAPNLHPLIIHFPIALLVSAVLVDLISLFTRKWQGVRISATILFTLGALGAGAAYWTGRGAADTVTLPTQAVGTLADHEDWALYTLLFFGIYAAVRLGLLWFDVKGRKWAQVWAHAALFAVGAAGLGILIKTGELGGELVYVHGLGVRAAQAGAQDGMAGMDHEGHDMSAMGGGSETVVPGADGSWSWTAGPSAASTLPAAFRFVSGSAGDMALESGPDSSVAIEARGTPLLFVAGDSLEGIQADAVLNADAFDGVVRLVHHVHDAQNYDYLEYSDGQVRQGRLVGGEAHVFDEKAVGSQGWVALRAYSSGTHFRGQVDGKPATHGHGSEPGAGPVGLYVQGQGRLLVKQVGVTAIP